MDASRTKKQAAVSSLEAQMLLQMTSKGGGGSSSSSAASPAAATVGPPIKKDSNLRLTPLPLTPTGAEALAKKESLASMKQHTPLPATNSGRQVATATPAAAAQSPAAGSSSSRKAATTPAVGSSSSRQVAPSTALAATSPTASSPPPVSNRKKTKQVAPLPPELQGYAPPDESPQARAIAFALASQKKNAPRSPSPEASSSSSRKYAPSSTNVTPVSVSPAPATEGYFASDAAGDEDLGSLALQDSHKISMRSVDQSILRTASGMPLRADYTVHFYPKWKEATFLENYFVLEIILHFLCGCFQLKRDRQLMVLYSNKVINFLSPVFGLLWCASMLLSLTFFTDTMNDDYFWLLLFAGFYPVIRLGFASVPLLKLLLSSFETWFLLIQVFLLVASFGALCNWNMKFYFAVVCLGPGLIQIILLDSNVSSVFYSAFAMLFGFAYTLIFTLLLGTGRIVEKDQYLTLQFYTISLIDFTNSRLITLMIFLLKNVVMLLVNPNSYIQIKSRVYKVPPTPSPNGRVSIA